GEAVPLPVGQLLAGLVVPGLAGAELVLPAVDLDIPMLRLLAEPGFLSHGGLLQNSARFSLHEGKVYQENAGTTRGYALQLSFLVMITYQPLVPASQAALIYLLESVFSSLVSVVAGYDSLTLPLIVGGALILLGNLLVELPRMLRPVPEAK